MTRVLFTKELIVNGKKKGEGLPNGLGDSRNLEVAVCGLFRRLVSAITKSGITLFLGIRIIGRG